MRTHVVLTQEEWAKFKPELVRANIKYSPSGYGENTVYIGMEVNDTERKLVDEILERI